MISNVANVSASLHDVCRLCTEIIAKGNAVHVFEDCQPQFLNIKKKIEDCVSLEMTLEDEMPKFICLACAQKVLDFNEFRLMVRDSDERFRKKIHIKKECEERGAEGGVYDCNDSFDHHDVEETLRSGEGTNDEDDDVPLSQLIEFKPTKRRRGRPRKDSYGITNYKTCNKLPKLKPFCEQCSMKFVAFEELRNHLKAVHDIAEVKDDESIGVILEKLLVYRCHICRQDFTNRVRLRKHCRQEHHIKFICPYACSFCERQFPTWTLCVVHERQHTGEKPHSCDICGKSNFVSLNSLRRHKLMHDRVFSCEPCKKSYNCESALRAHLQSKHSDERPYLCSVCGRSFSLAVILSAHMTSHSGERKYKCEICGFRSKTSGNHHRHRARHNKIEEKLFHCETCGKSYETKLKLSSHSVIHRSVRPHACKICGKGFIYRNKMERHLMQVHAKDRRFPCHLCNRKLSTKFGLSIHLKTHSRNIQSSENELPGKKVEIQAMTTSISGPAIFTPVANVAYKNEGEPKESVL